MTRAPGRAAWRAVAFAALGLILAGCGTSRGTPATPELGGGSGAPGGSGDTPRGTSGTLASGPSATPPDEASPITLDTTLLGFLPVSVDDAPVREDLDAASQALLDPALSRIASGASAGVAVTGGDLVTAWVFRVRRDAFGEEAFRQWRESFDEGACNAAGGVRGQAQADLGGRTTYITTCVGALRTYHVWLQEQSVLVSASSVGESRFGEKLMTGLRMPQ